MHPYFSPRAPGARPLVVLGAMNFGKRTDARTSESILARALERGVRVVDTANVYNDGQSETIVGKALAGRDDVLVATKVGLARRDGKPEGLAPDMLARAVDESRKRLGRDVIELYYLHAPDPHTALDQTIDALAALIETNAIKRFGVSNYAAWQILEIVNLCDERDVPRPAVSQVLYNVLIRQLEVEYFAFTSKYAMHSTIYNPLAGGFLSGRHALGDAPKGSRFDGNAMYLRRYWSPAFFSLLDRYRAVASDEGLTLIELSYAWLCDRPGVDSILIGPASIEHLDAALDAVEKSLSPAAKKRIDEIHAEFTGTDAKYAR